MADSFASFDKYRISFDGANNATSATDALGHTLNFNGSAALSTAAWKYGTASLSVPSGAGNYVSTPNSSDLDLGTGDFCIDGWFRSNAATPQRFFALHDGGVPAIELSALSTRVLLYLNNTTAIDTTTSAWTIPNELPMFHHVAVTRASGVVRVYLDGTKIAQVTFSSAISFSGTTVLWIGAGSAGGGMNGNVDEFRFTKGAARWSGDAFVPPVNNFDSAESAVTITSLGTRTRQVSAYGALYHDSVISATNDAIVSLGWTLWDVVYKNTVTCVYRCLNADGSSYKYAALVWDRHRFRVSFITMESWDQTTHTITNEAFNNNRANGVHGYAMQNCDIIVFGSNRYLGIMTYLQGSPSLWHVCTEFEREAAEDTAGGVPCWGMVWAEEIGNNSYASNGSYFVAFPRTKDGQTGQNAFNNQMWLSNFGGWGSLGLPISNGKPADFINNANTTYRTFSYGWDTSKKLISHFRVTKLTGSTDTSITAYGRAFALKFCPPLGASVMDRVSVPIDSNLWFASGGTATDHWVLPCANIQNVVTYGTGSVFSDGQSWASGQTVQCFCYTGQYIYYGTTAGVYKLDTASGANAIVSGTSGSIFDIKFDGRYVYAATASGVTQIDTNNGDSLVSVTVGTGGVYSLAISLRGHLICGNRTASTTANNAYRIDIPSMGNVSAAIVAPSTTTAAVYNDMCFDDTGQYCAYITVNGTTAADNRVGRIDAFALSAATSYTINVVQTYGGISWQQQYFTISYGTASSSTIATLNANASAVLNSHYANVLGTTTTVGTPARGFAEKVFGQFYITYVISAGTLNILTAAGAAPLGPQSSGVSPTTGTTAASAHTKGIAFTPNLALTLGLDNTFYCAKNMFYKGYNTVTNYSCYLLPK